MRISLWLFFIIWHFSTLNVLGVVILTYVEFFQFEEIKFVNYIGNNFI